MKHIMENLTEQLKKDMNKIIGDFKSDEIMMEVLKKRLTKKEFKFAAYLLMVVLIYCSFNSDQYIQYL